MQKILIGFHIFGPLSAGWSVPVKQIIQYCFLVLGKGNHPIVSFVTCIIVKQVAYPPILSTSSKVTQQYFAKIENPSIWWTFFCE